MIYEFALFIISAGQDNNQGEAIDISRESDMEDKSVARIGYQGEQSSPARDDDYDSDCSVEIEEESWSLDSEVGKRLNQMIPIAVSTSIFFLSGSISSTLQKRI